MKTKLRKKAKAAGHALVVAMVIGSILCITLTGYLTVVQQQTLLSARSQAWNLAITLVEAGIEEGLEHMNVNPTAPWADGWTQSGIWWYHQQPMGGGNSYTVYVNTTNLSQPVIMCKADVQTATFVKYASAAPAYFFAAIGVNTTNSTKVNRTVQVRTSRGSLFTKAMVARNLIDMNGNDILTDSFDSDSLFKSWYGKYKPSWYVGDNGDIASNGNLLNTISIGNANIYGHVSTGPSGTAYVGVNGGIGSHAWQTANPGGVQPNDAQNQWYSHDSNFTFPNTPLPYTSGSSLPSGGDVPISETQVTASLTNSTTYPNPPPWSGVTTNVTSWTTNSTYPGPMVGLVTNIGGTLTTSATYPVPTPPGVVTNYLGQFSQQTSYVPASGSYVPGTLATNNNGTKPYSWNSFTSRSYSYYGFVYAWAASFNYRYSLYTTNTTWTTNHYDVIINSGGNYYTTASSIGNVLVNASDVNLVMANGLNMGGSDGITISPGANMNLYCGGTSAKIAGNAVVNKGGYASSFIMYCTPSVTSFDFNGNGEFTGVLVAPNAHIDMNGGGAVNFDFIGAMVVESVKMNGHFLFHYDEALGRNTSHGRLLVTSWDEVDPNAALPVTN